MCGALKKGGFEKKEHRTSNVQHRTLNEGKDDETEIGVECSVLDVCFFIRSAGGRQVLARLWRVGRWMFDVGRSSFKPIPYGKCNL